MKHVCFLASAASVHTVRWINALYKHGYKITLVTMEKPYKDNIHPDIRVIELPYKGNKGYYMNRRALKKILKELNPDILHAHYASGYGTLARLVRFKPYVLSVWGSDVYLFPKQSRLKAYILKKNLQAATVIASTSSDMRKETYKYIDNRKSIYLTPFGIDLNKFSFKDYKTSKKQIDIGIVKRLEKVYGVEYLILAISELKKRLIKQGMEDLSNKIKLTIVGGGSIKKELVDLACSLKLEKSIEFVGDIPNEEVPSYLKRFDIYCAPSLSESFGVAILEASAVGLPVVASNVGGIPEVVLDGQTGYLVRPENSKDIVDKLYHLIANESLIDKMGREGRRFVEENYEWADSVKFMANLYDETLKN
ncbi:glycosyltransferase [Priestia megaterium]|uniref:glycosyltransferase n=1 Tax=Priestia megaterium TaxID=1404 RepID=UPI003671C26E